MTVPNMMTFGVDNASGFCRAEPRNLHLCDSVTRTYDMTTLLAL